MGNCQNLSVGNDPIKAEKIKKNNSNNLQSSTLFLEEDAEDGNEMMIKTYTWNRDSHGLFDYESKGIIKNQLKIPEPGVIVRDKDEIKVMSNQNFKGDLPDLKKLAFVEIRNNHYVVDSELLSNTETDYKVKKSSQDEGIGDLCVWAVVKSLKTSKGQKGHELQVGDYLKLGRVRFRIKELQGLETEKKQWNKNMLFGSNLNILNMDDNTNNKNESEVQKEQDDTASNSQNTCRICLGDNDELDNPFITPCKCDGTMKCIHIKCLQQWLKSRLHPKQTAYSISFVWKTFDCELCKSQFPNMVKVKGNMYDTVEIPRPSPPYVTMEILSKDKNICKGIHVITLSQKNQIRLGRGHDSDIRISDISVSRCHAILSYESGIFTLEDNNSKFGTLALIKDPIQLTNSNNNIAIQVGRTVLSFILKKNWKIFQVAIPPQSANKQNKNESSPEKEKKQTKIKTIEAPGQKDEENVMNQKIDSGDNANQMQPVNNHAPRFMSQQAEQSHQKSNQQQVGNIHSNNSMGGADSDGNAQQHHHHHHQSSNQANNTFQLPEFKDPAEELEAFQRQKEKESEIQILDQQLVLLVQHKNINQQHLQNLQNNTEEAKNDQEKTNLVNRIEQYTQKIQEIEQKIKGLQSNERKEMKENNNQTNNQISERSDNQSYQKNGYQESIFAENNGQKVQSQKGIQNNTEYNPNGESQQSESKIKF